MAEFEAVVEEEEAVEAVESAVEAVEGEELHIISASLAAAPSKPFLTAVILHYNRGFQQSFILKGVFRCAFTILFN